jgi:flagellar biosynthesis protein
MTNRIPQPSDSPEEVSLNQQQAVALSYRQHDLPRVVAKGRGYVAQKIVDTAEAAGVPLHQDDGLTQALSALEIKQAIPHALFAAVAQVLVFAFEVKRQKEQQAEQPTDTKQTNHTTTAKTHSVRENQG